MRNADRETAEESLKFFGHLAAAEAFGESADEVPQEFRELFAKGAIAWGETEERDP